MVKQKAFRVPDKLATQLEKDAIEKTISENDWGIQAFEHYLSCKKLEQVGAMRLIVLKFKDQCINPKCKRPIDAGEWALWGRGTGVICIDCYVTRIGDKPLVAKYLKMREYKQIIKALSVEADRLAGTVEGYQLGDKLNQLVESSSGMHKAAMEYLREAIGTDKEKEALEELIRSTTKNFEIQKNIELFLERSLHVKKWKTVKKKEKATQ